jgi:hypothetical protein
VIPKLRFNLTTKDNFDLGMEYMKVSTIYSENVVGYTVTGCELWLLT